MKKIGMAAITVAVLLSLSHARADDITGDILHEDCIVASHGSGSDRDCDIYIKGCILSLDLRLLRAPKAWRPLSSAQCMPRAMNIGQNIAHLNAGKRQVRGF
jgi:hypothetical protein